MLVRLLKSVGMGLAAFVVWAAVAFAIRAALGGTSIRLPWGLGYPAEASWIYKMIAAGAIGAVVIGWEYWKWQRNDSLLDGESSPPTP